MPETPRQLAERFIKEELIYLPDWVRVNEWLLEELGGFDDVPGDLVDSVTEIAERVVKALTYSL